MRSAARPARRGGRRNPGGRGGRDGRAWARQVGDQCGQFADGAGGKRGPRALVRLGQGEPSSATAAHRMSAAVSRSASEARCCGWTSGSGRMKACGAGDQAAGARSDRGAADGPVAAGQDHRRQGGDDAGQVEGLRLGWGPQDARTRISANATAIPATWTATNRRGQHAPPGDSRSRTTCRTQQRRQPGGRGQPGGVPGPVQEIRHPGRR